MLLNRFLLLSNTQCFRCFKLSKICFLIIFIVLNILISLSTSSPVEQQSFDVKCVFSASQVGREPYLVELRVKKMVLVEEALTKSDGPRGNSVGKLVESNIHLKSSF